MITSDPNKPLDQILADIEEAGRKDAPLVIVPFGALLVRLSRDAERFVIRTLKVGDKTLENVVGGIAPVAGSLLLGQSFLSRFKSWAIDNQKRALILN
jgi:hypothetical protein